MIYVDTSVNKTPGTEGSRLLRVDIFLQLREDILSCRLAPGSELREAELADRFSVSKSPVHDALFRLAQEGLVIVMPRQGYRVAPVSLPDVRDMFQFRLTLEVASVKIVTQSATDEALRALDRFRHFDPSAYPGGFISYNRAFHRALTELSGNARLMRAAWDLIDQMDRVVTVSVNAIKRRDPSKLIRQHCDIIDALQARESRKAERMVRRHVSQAEKRVCDALSRLLVVA